MRSERSRFSLPAVWSALAGAMFVLVLALLTLGQPALSRYYQNLSLAGNLALAPAALAAVSLLLWGRARLEAADARPGGRGALWRMRALFAAVLAVQLVVARCAWYKMGWDIANVYTTAEELARGQALTASDYFRLCPNNAPLTILQAVPMWVAVKLGLAVPFVVLPYLDAVLLNLTAYFTVRCAQRITPSRWARGFAAAVSILWIALSPYVLYPYTDTWAVLFPVLALYAWLTVRRPAIRWGLISLACFAGAAVKPTVLIVLIALGLLALCRFLGRRDFSAAAWKRALAVLAALVLGAVPGQAFQRAATAYLAGSAVPQEQLSETHYLMLGMNGETYGGHSPDDVTFSQSFESLTDRQQANLQRAWERVCEKGLWGNVRFFTIKLYKAYADGSFARQFQLSGLGDPETYGCVEHLHPQPLPSPRQPQPPVPHAGPGPCGWRRWPCARLRRSRAAAVRRRRRSRSRCWALRPICCCLRCGRDTCLFLRRCMCFWPPWRWTARFLRAAAKSAKRPDGSPCAPASGYATIAAFAA